LQTDITTQNNFTLQNLAQMNRFKNSLFFIAIAMSMAGLLASCANDEKDVLQNNTLVSLKLQGTASNGVRSTTTPTNENAINRVAVGVFYADGSVNTIVEPTISGDAASFTCMASSGGTPCDIVVVANAPAGTFTGATTKSAFLLKTVALTQTSNDLPISGEKTQTLTAGAANSVTVDISRLVARIEISSITTNFATTGIYANAKFSPDRIFLYNAKSVSDVQTTTAPNTTVSLNGWDGTNAVTGLLDEPTGVTLSVGGTKTYSTTHYFYTFTNLANASAKTKLIIGGNFDVNGDGTITPADGDGYVYYPIVINRDQSGTTITATGYTDKGTTAITRNMKYQLSAEIKGKGVSSVTEDIAPADVNLSVNVVDWTLTVDQSVIFE